MNAEIAGVDEVGTVAGVEVREGRDGWADPADGEGGGGSGGSAVVGVVDHELRKGEGDESLAWWEVEELGGRE